jgi:hypothetical protein
MRIARIFVVAIQAIVSSSLFAETIALPQNERYFNVSLPEGWLTNTEADGSMKFAANDKTPLITVIRPSKSPHR